METCRHMTAGYFIILPCKGKHTNTYSVAYEIRDSMNRILETGHYDTQTIHDSIVELFAQRYEARRLFTDGMDNKGQLTVYAVTD